MQAREPHRALRSALRGQMAESVDAMRRLGLDDREVADATRQTRDALRVDGKDQSHPLRATPIHEAIRAQVRLSELTMRALGLSEEEIRRRTRVGSDAIGDEAGHDRAA